MARRLLAVTLAASLCLCACELRGGQHDRHGRAPGASSVAVPSVAIAPGVMMPQLIMGGYTCDGLEPDPPWRTHPNCTLSDGAHDPGHPSNYSLWLGAPGVGGLHQSGVDTAWQYETQAAVGAAVRASGRPRSDFFIGTKIPCNGRGGSPPMNASSAASYISQDLAALQMDYVDLILLHWPCTTADGTLDKQMNAMVWKALEQALRLGQTRAIGVSSFFHTPAARSGSALDALVASATVPPSVNQIYYGVNIGDQNMTAKNETLRYCAQHNITVQAFGCLAALRKHPPDWEVVERIANTHSVSAAQVLIRWVTQQGIVVVTGSTELAYDREDINSFGFVLSGTEMAQLSAVSATIKSDDDGALSCTAAFYRFEDESNLGADSAGNSPLSTKSPLDGPKYSWKPASDAGSIVGGYLDFEGEHDKNGGPTLHGFSTAFTAQEDTPLPGFTFEMLFNLGANFNRAGNTTLFSLKGSGGDSLAELALERHSITFRVDSVAATGEVSQNCLAIPLDQIGRRSYFYLTDGSWHHVAATMDMSNPIGVELRVFLDGESPGGFSSVLPSATGTAIYLGRSVFSLLPTPFSGRIDEVALYNTSITAQEAFVHYTRAIKHHVKYTNDLVVVPPAPAPASTIGVLDPKEFAPGTICPGWLHNCTPLIVGCNPAHVFSNGSTPGTPDQPTTLEQLQKYPLPRYNKPALNLGLFPWNTNWATRYTGGSPSIGQPYSNPCRSNCSKMYNGKVVTQPPYVLICKVRNHTCEAQRAAQQWRDIQLELGTHWRQPIYIDSSNMTIDLANANPHIPLYYIISRGGDTILWNTSKVASTDSASRKCFVQNAVGNLLSVDGVALNMNTSIRPHEYASNGIFRPCVTKECATEAECPLEHLYNHDGSSWVQQFKQFAQNGLKRPINRLYDDGEIMSVWHMLNHALDQDPVMVRDYERVGIPLLAGGQRDWEAFTSKWRWLNTEGFRARFISDPELLTFDAEYSEYDVAGTTLFGGFDAWSTCATGDWSYTRRISHEQKTGIAGTANHFYATPSIYPWDPSGRTCGQGGPHQGDNFTIGQQALWDAGIGSWAGIDLLMYTRPSEIAHGDHYFMPFMSAGWTEREEMSLRPAQLLGLLKTAMGMGAHYFNDFTGSYFARPENWIWQVVLHTYAQAIASQVSDLFLNSTLMEPSSYPVPPRACFVLSSPSQSSQATEQACSQNYDASCDFKYRWVTGNESACYDPRWPPINYRFWAGDQSIVVVVRKDRLAGKYLIVTTVQPQSNMVGNAPISVNISFMLNGYTNVSLLSRRQGSVYVLNNETDDPTLVQLDSWHEESHPSWWSKDFFFEAEAHHLDPSAGPKMLTKLSTAFLAPIVVTVRRTDASGVYDFVGSASFARLSVGTVAEYRFQPRAPKGLRHFSTLSFRLVVAGRRGGECITARVGAIKVAAGAGDAQNYEHQKICFSSGATMALGRGKRISVLAGLEHAILLQSIDTDVDVDWIQIQLAEPPALPQQYVGEDTELIVGGTRVMKD